jgi:hypothetical protein
MDSNLIQLRQFIIGYSGDRNSKSDSRLSEMLVQSKYRFNISIHSYKSHSQKQKSILASKSDGVIAEGNREQKQMQDLKKVAQWECEMVCV